MRVRNTTSRERRKGGTARRMHLIPLRQRETDGEEDGAAAEPVAAPPRDEDRARAYGGPIDRAHYACSCGYLFHADVSTTVVCPHCGTTQDW